MVSTNADLLLAELRRRLDERKKHARLILHKYMRKHKVPYPVHCEQCGSKRKVQLHHLDYDQPLFYQALCVKRCHGPADVKRRELEAAWINRQLKELA
jgi:hypothetical protein